MAKSISRDDLIDFLTSPRRVRGDQGEIENRSVDEIIKAYDFIQKTSPDYRPANIVRNALMRTTRYPQPCAPPRGTTGAGGDSPIYEHETPGDHGLTVQQGSRPLPVYIDATGQVFAAQADDPNTLHNAFVISTPANNKVILQAVGWLQCTHGLTVGQYYYLSDTVAGDYVDAAPAIDDALCFVPYRDVLQLYTTRPVR
jgi:hypothetical protein